MCRWFWFLTHEWSLWQLIIPARLYPEPWFTSTRCAPVVALFSDHGHKAALLHPAPEVQPVVAKPLCRYSGGSSMVLAMFDVKGNIYSSVNCMVWERRKVFWVVFPTSPAPVTPASLCIVAVPLKKENVVFLLFQWMRGRTEESTWISSFVFLEPFSSLNPSSEVFPAPQPLWWFPWPLHSLCLLSSDSHSQSSVAWSGAGTPTGPHCSWFHIWKLTYSLKLTGDPKSALAVLLMSFTDMSRVVTTWKIGVSLCVCF